MARLLPLLLLCCAARAEAEPPLKVRVAALVLAEGEVPATALARTREDVRGVLEASESFVLLEPPPQAEALAARCDEDVACWRGATRAAGLEQLLVLRVHPEGEQLIAEGAVYSHADTAPRGAEPLPRGGGAPLPLLQSLLLDPGTLRIRAQTPGAQLWVDGELRRIPATALSAELPLPAGKHHLRVEAPGHHPAGLTFTVLAGQPTSIDVTLVERVELHPWRRLGVTLGMAAGGAGLVAGLLATPDPATR